MAAPQTRSTPDTFRLPGRAAEPQPYTPMQEAALIVLRLVVAAVFLYAGTAKWPLWSAPFPGMSPLMHDLMLFLSIVEPLGAVALLLGFLTRWAAAGLAIIMVGAVVYSRVTMHASLFTGPQATGLDYNLLLFAGCVALLAFGGGRWTVDHRVARSGTGIVPRTGDRAIRAQARGTP